jgi:FdhE protein
MSASPALESLRHARPEWMSWLGVIEEVVHECDSPHWVPTVPDPAAHRPERVPLLAGTSAPLQARVIRRWLERLIRLAAMSGTDVMLSLAAARPSEPESVELFTSSIRSDTEAITRIAAAYGVDAEALQAVGALLPVPFLHACNLRLAGSVPAGWAHGYCPVCGAWPAFAEIRGIERSRHFRCARCGGEWYARALACPFCDLSDHTRLATLVPGKSDVHDVIDACNGCGRYVKVFTRLQGCPPAAVMIEDLASVGLDMAALEQGYGRPADTGFPVGVTVIEPRRTRRVFGWG